MQSLSVGRRRRFHGRGKGSWRVCFACGRLVPGAGALVVQVWVAEHFAMPFGAKASVFAWERLGHFIATVSRRLLRLPVFRYVDDFFAPEPQVCVSRLTALGLSLSGVHALSCPCEESLEHAASCFARLVRAILGVDAIADAKRDHGMVLTVLGIDIEMLGAGFKLRVSPQKVCRCFFCCFVVLCPSLSSRPPHTSPFDCRHLNASSKYPLLSRVGACCRETLAN